MEHVTETKETLQKSTLWLIIYDNRRENKLVLFVSMEIVTMHEKKNGVPAK